MENGSQVCQALNKLVLTEFPFGFCPYELWLQVHFTVNPKSAETLDGKDGRNYFFLFRVNYTAKPSICHLLL